MDGNELTLQALSECSREPVETLREWLALGILGSEGLEVFTRADVERVRLIQFLLRRGISVGEIVRAHQEEDLLARYLQMIFPTGIHPTYTLREAAEILGADFDAVRRLWEASGLSEQGDLVYEEDLQALRAFRVAEAAGLPEEALVQLARVYADALGRVAEVESRLFHFYVHDRLRANGLAGRDLIAAGVVSGDQMTPLVEPAILYFHRKGRQRSAREDAVMYLHDVRGSEDDEVPGRLRVAIVFVDLASFTQLTDAMGDQAAAQVIERFSQLVRETVKQSEGRVVKQIGDGFMLVFPQPLAAVTCALEIERRAVGESHFPAVRSGIHCGHVLYREGDYLGNTSNVAARLAAEAGRHQVLVSAAVREEVGSLPDAELVSLGKRRFKGLMDEIEVFEVVPLIQEQASHRVVDPVCGMELDPRQVAATLALRGQERAFCSQECLQRFVATPERYEADKPRTPG